MVGAVSENHLEELSLNLVDTISYIISDEFHQYFDPVEFIYIWNIEKNVEKFDQQIYYELTESLNQVYHAKFNLTESDSSSQNDGNENQESSPTQ